MQMAFGIIPFYLILNGVKQNDKAETNVKIVGLNIDRANLKVVFENNTIAIFDEFKTSSTRQSLESSATRSTITAARCGFM